MRTTRWIILWLAAVASSAWLGCARKESDKVKELETRIAALEMQSENNGLLAARGLALTKQAIAQMHRGLTGYTNGPNEYWPGKSNGLWTVIDK